MLQRLGSPGRWSPIRFKSTWRQYRYGSKSKRPPARIFTGKHRRQVVDGAVLHLKNWRFSPFENEASCRTGIRQSLCAKGHAWEAADTEAAAIVAEAFRILGLRRPTWDEGQWHYAVPRENCARCGSPIDDEDQARGFRYCSDVCARAYRQHIADQLPWDHELRRMGYWQIFITNAPVLTCAHCGKGFKTIQSGGAKYCSPECQRVGQRTLADKPCKWCGEMFRPKDRSKVYCSMACRDASRVHKWKTELPSIACPVCKTIFRPGSPKAIYCSPACFRVVKNERRRKG